MKLPWLVSFDHNGLYITLEVTEENKEMISIFIGEVARYIINLSYTDIKLSPSRYVVLVFSGFLHKKLTEQLLKRLIRKKYPTLVVMDDNSFLQGCTGDYKL